MYGGQLLCNRDTLVGALLNLIENALQAGTPQVRLKVHLYARDNNLRLCVSDSASGIEPKVLARLGEPFFTTKATGTELGLAGGQCSGASASGSAALTFAAGAWHVCLAQLAADCAHGGGQLMAMKIKVLLVEDDRALRDAS